MRKNLDPNLKPEKQNAMPKNENLEKPHIGQERADQEEEHLIPSIMQLIKHPTCHRKFLVEQK